MAVVFEYFSIFLPTQMKYVLITYINCRIYRYVFIICKILQTYVSKYIYTQIYVNKIEINQPYPQITLKNKYFLLADSKQEQTLTVITPGSGQAYTSVKT